MSVLIDQCVGLKKLLCAQKYAHIFFAAEAVPRIKNYCSSLYIKWPNPISIRQNENFVIYNLNASNSRLFYVKATHI